MLSLCFTSFLLFSCGGGGDSSNETTTPPTPTNVAPTANAGIDQSVNEEVVVTLTGTGSDSDGSVSSYLWSQVTGTTISLADSSNASTTFTAPTLTASTTLTFELTVTDDDGSTGKDTVDIVISPVNLAPTANAGSSQSVEEQSLVTLMGSGTDSDGTITSFSWLQSSGANVALSDSLTASATFIAPLLVEEATLTFELTITDNEGTSNQDSVDVTVLPIVTPDPIELNYSLLRPNGYVPLENVDEISNTAYSIPEATISIDANNDGLNDLLLGPTNYAAEPELALVLFINQGDGKFIEDAAGVIDNVPLVGYLNHPSLVADFNGDGADDAFLVDQGLEVGSPPFVGHQPILLLSNNEGGLINASESHLPMLTEFHHSASVGDIDLDGDLDILGVTLSELSVYILINDGKGNFSLRTEGLPEDIVSELANKDIGAITLAHVNNDKRLDIVFGTYHNAPTLQVFVALQDENGNFVESQTLTFTQTYEKAGIDLLLAADLDGDGDDDVIGKMDISSLPGEENTTEGGLTLFALRNDNGMYTNVTETWLGGGVVSELLPNPNISGLYLQDINGDDHLDLLFANSGIELNQLGHYLYINNGKGQFFPAKNTSVDSDLSISPQWYMDHDNDGDMDIVAMWPDVTIVDGKYISTGYEIIVLERE